MKHPYESLSPLLLRRLYWTSLGLTLAIAAVLQGLVAEFTGNTPGQPAAYTIIHLEFAGTMERAQAIMSSWGPENCERIIMQTYVDYVFLLTYPQAIALGILAVLRNSRNRRLLIGGRLLAWLQWLAGLLDAVENAALIALLKGNTAAWLAPLAWWSAVPKFAIVLAGIMFVIVFAGLAYTRDSEPATA